MAGQGLISSVVAALRFKETVLFKETSELEERLKVLEVLKDEYPDNKDLTKEYWMAKKGVAGEREIIYQLKNAHIGMYVLHDVRLKFGSETTQIDFVIITPLYIYYVECKNYAGNITVMSNGDFLREETENGKKVKKGFYSPLRQVEVQRETVRKIWERDASKMQKLLTSKSFENRRRVLVAFTNPDCFLNTYYAPKNIQDKVIRADALIRKIEDDLKNAESAMYFDTKKEMEKTAQAYLDLCEKGGTDYREYYLRKFNCRDLKSELVDFRKLRAKEMKMPPYYIFNDKELGELSERNPKTIDELAQILPAIKVKTHGAEILKIINR